MVPVVLRKCLLFVFMNVWFRVRKGTRPFLTEYLFLLITYFCLLPSALCL